MKTPPRKILHIFDKPEFDKNLRKAFDTKGFDCISETDPDKAIDDLSYRIGIILVSGKMLRREMPQFFRSFKKCLFNKIPIIAIISEEEEFYKRGILNLGFNDYISGKIDAAHVAEYAIDFLQKAQITRDRLENASIAIIDDIKVHAEAFQMLLETRGLRQSQSYKSAETFLDSPRECNIYVVDIILKNISGIKLIQTIRKLYPKSLIIAVSSLTDDRIGPTAIDKGADIFMNKPLNVDLFLNKIMAWLR
jgi:DNA-binding response OmpR family regulator